MRNPGAKLKPSWLSSAALAAALTMIFAFPAFAQPEEGGDDASASEETVAEPVTTAEEPVIDTSAESAGVPTAYQDYVREMIDNMPKPFEFHGYMRAGYGITSKGTDNVSVTPPTIFPQRWRLGNENDNYVEAVFVNNWINPERESDSAWFKTQLLITWITNQDSNFDTTTVALRESFAQAGNVIKSKPGLSFWAGQRYYRRHDIHVIDWFYLSNSGYGGGFEDLDLGFGKMHVALMGGANNDPANNTGDGQPAKYGFDVRISDIKVPGGSGTLQLWPTYASNNDNVDGEVGIAAAFIHTKGGFMGGFNKAHIQFGTGPSSNFDTFDAFGQPGGRLGIRASDQLQIQPSPKLSLMGTVAFDYLDNGNDDGAGQFKRTWIAAGVRPIYHMTKYAAIAAELGLDFVNIDQDGDENDISGPLIKFTVAPTITPGASFWGRPQIRAYASAFVWTSDLEGQVGGGAFNTDTFGATFGVQAESWW